MKHIRRQKLSGALAHALGAGVAASLAITGAYAQQAQKVEKIEVTGSNIKRVDTETPAPVQVITRQDIERTGKSTIADVIRELPSDNNGSIPLSFGSGFAAGASGISLRGLTANSTLVLINGRRTAPYGLADDGQRNFVNINTIPLDAVERIEVLKDGASAIYGSDAIAGVVNIILRNDFQGVTASAAWGQTRYNDGDTGRATLTAGKGELARDRYNVFFNLEATSIDNIWQKDRQGRDWIGDPDVRRWGYSLTAGTTLAHLAGYIRPATGATAAVSANPYGAVRNPADLGYVQLAGCPNTYTLPANLGGCLWSPSDYRDIQPESKSFNIFGRGTFAITSMLTGYIEGSYYKDHVETHNTPSSVSSAWPDIANNTVRNNATIALGPNHPDNPFAGTAARFRYVTADVGGRNSEYENEVTRFVGGLKGSAWNWDFDTAVLYVESKADIERKGFLRDSVLRSLLNGTNPLGYYRLGVNAGMNSPELYAALSPTLVNNTKTSVTSWDVKATRELMQLAGGPMGLALGAETRKEELNSPPTPYTDVADIIGLGYAAFDQSRRVNAIYGELAAPILKSVELSAALRTDDYSDYGRSTTPKFGVRWTPMQQLLVRATYAEGFRAPGAAESGNSSAAGFTSFHDPVRCPVTDVGCEGTTVVITTGNPLVKPEESKSWTAGFVFEPFRNASVSVDYWKIRRENEISGADVNLVLANPAGFPTAQIIRDTNDLPGIPNSGTVLAVGAPYVNVSKTETDGWDLDLQYRFTPGPMGRFSAGLLWTYIASFKKFQPDGTVTEYVGTHGPTGLSSNAGTPRNRGTLTFTWENGPLTLSTNTAYVSGVKNIEFAGDPNGCLNAFADGSDAPDNCKVGSFTTTSLFGKFKWNQNFEIFGSVTNIFDKVAPLDPQTYGAYRYNPTFHLAGAIGLAYSIGARYTFR
jgi:iron complex outermembrane receptor protein